MEELIKWEGDYIVCSRLVGEYDTKLLTKDDPADLHCVIHSPTGGDKFYITKIIEGKLYGKFLG